MELARALVVAALLAGILGTTESASARAVALQDCTTLAASNGVRAEAVARCSTHPEFGVTPDVDCPLPSYDVVVHDDSVLAVFPGAVVAGHTVTPIGDNETSEGFDNNFGTVFDVQGPDRAVRSTSPAYAVDPMSRRFSSTGRWWRQTCWETADSNDELRVARTRGPFPEGPDRPLRLLVQNARAQVDPPPVPPVRFAGPASLVQLPTWFWVDPTWWERPHRGSDSHGNVSITVEAAPRRWSLGSDGRSLLTCDGPGLPWTVQADDRSGCTHTFTDVPDQNPLLDLSVELAVSWSSSISSYGVQPLDPIYRTARSDHEIRSVVGLRR